MGSRWRHAPAPATCMDPLRFGPINDGLTDTYLPILFSPQKPLTDHESFDSATALGSKGRVERRESRIRCQGPHKQSLRGDSMRLSKARVDFEGSLDNAKYAS